MSRKKSGIDMLVSTLVKQHGVEKAYWASKKQAKETPNDGKIRVHWSAVVKKLEGMRSCGNN